jgi:hypothetical protein
VIGESGGEGDKLNQQILASYSTDTHLSAVFHKKAIKWKHD